MNWNLRYEEGRYTRRQLKLSSLYHPHGRSTQNLKTEDGTNNTDVLSDFGI